MQIEKITTTPAASTGDAFKDMFAQPITTVEVIDVPAPDMKHDLHTFRHTESCASVRALFESMGKIGNSATQAYLQTGEGLGLDVKSSADEKSVTLEASSNNPRALAVFRLLADINCRSNTCTKEFKPDTAPAFVSQWSETASQMMSNIGLPVTIKREADRTVRVETPSTQAAIMFNLGIHEGWFSKSVEQGKLLSMPTPAQLITDWKAGIKAPKF